MGAGSRLALPLLGVALVFAVPAGAQLDAAWAAEHLGVYLWPTYPRLGGFTLSELTPIAEELGVSVVRLHVGSHFGREASFVQVLQSRPYREAIERFGTIILTLADSSGRQYEPAWTEAQYAELTTYLLREYAGSEKTFILGLWETDHWLPLDETGRDYLRARQRGISRAREERGEDRVRVLSMVEVTKASGDCVAERLLPRVPPEVVSLSWWAHANEVGDALRRLQALLPEAVLMVGEMGLTNRRRDPDRDAKLLAAIDEARGAGAEWVILWRLDDWEYGLVEAKPDGGWGTDLWRALWPAFHDGMALNDGDWRPRGEALVLEAPLADGGLAAKLPVGRWDLDSLDVRTDAGLQAAALAWPGGRCEAVTVLPPQSALLLRADGQSRLSVGPVRANGPEDWQPWQPTGLNWNEEFAVWQPAARSEEGYLEVRVEADHPILGGEMWLCGRKAQKGDWGVRVQGYDGDWLGCPEVCDWRGEQLLTTFPASFPSEWGPVREVVLRFWVRTDDESDDWVWTTSITSARASLDLDTCAVPWPDLSAELLATATGQGTVRLTITPAE